MRQLIDMQYERNDMDLARGKFRIRGDTLEIVPAYEEAAVRVSSSAMTWSASSSWTH